MDVPAATGVNVIAVPLIAAVATLGVPLVTVMPDVGDSEHTAVRLLVDGYVTEPLVTVLLPSLNDAEPFALLILHVNEPVLVV